MSYELPFIPDKEIACELQQKYPLPFDKRFLYNDDLHKYIYVDSDVKGCKIYVHKHVYGTTTLIKNYKNDFDAYGFYNSSVRGKIMRVYNEWLESDEPRPKTDAKNWGIDYQDYIPLDVWELMHRHLSKGENFVHLFEDYFSNRALFRILTEENEGGDKFSDEIIQKFQQWEATDRDPYQYFSILGIEDGFKCFCFPPHVYPTDIVNFWNGTTVLGSLLHRRIELYYNGHPVPPIAAPEWNYFLNFVNDHHLTVIRTELNVGIPRLRLCGQIDAVALSACGSYLIMIDWKRSKKLKSDPTKDLHYKKNPDKFMLPPWDHLPDCARSDYTIQQNVYVQCFYEMAGIDYEPDHPIANLKFEKLYLNVLHPINSDYIMIDLPIFKPKQKNHDAMLKMFELRAKEIEIKLSEDAYIEDTDVSSVTVVEEIPPAEESNKRQRLSEEELPPAEESNKRQRLSEAEVPVVEEGLESKDESSREEESNKRQRLEA